MRRRPLAALASLVLALAGMLATAALAAPAHAVPDRDCGDFATQAAAQRFFLDQGAPRSDPHRLDDDGDGVACESNPCPCSDSRGGGGGGDDGRPPQPRPEPIRRDAAIVLKVIDGDTVRVRVSRSGLRRDVRLLGIDTPEVYGRRECGGPQASRALRTLLPRNTRVQLVSDRSQALTDRYDRLLRYVVRGRVDASKAQLRLGMARTYTVSRPVARHREYAATQAAARRADRGSWRTCW